MTSLMMITAVAGLLDGAYALLMYRKMHVTIGEMALWMGLPTLAMGIGAWASPLLAFTLVQVLAGHIILSGATSLLIVLYKEKD